MPLVGEEPRAQPEDERREQRPRVSRKEREGDGCGRIRKLETQLPRIEQAVRERQGCHECPERENKNQLSPAQPEGRTGRLSGRCLCTRFEFANRAHGHPPSSTCGSIREAALWRQTIRDA